MTIDVNTDNNASVGAKTDLLTARLVAEFTASRYSGAAFATWPLGRKVHAFLAARRDIQDYEGAFIAVYAARRRIPSES